MKRLAIVQDNNCEFLNAERKTAMQ